jgi:nicotinate-nucleotide--dimethylbenzimidazole phosphoribosyltransferase
MTIFEQIDFWISRIPIEEEIESEKKEIAREIQHRLDSLIKPQGSLGRLEELILWYGLVCRRSRFPDPSGVVAVFAGDHGIAASGVSAFPQIVTVEMVKNFSNGGAAVNVLSRQAGLELLVFDMGINADLSSLPSVQNAKVAYGTRNLLTERAMAPSEMVQAMKTGFDLSLALKSQGKGFLVIGEMGIGNTTSASALISALLDLPPVLVTGRGTGLDDHGPTINFPLEWGMAVGGFEIAAMAGAILGAATVGLPVILDGVITSSAALLAWRICPRVKHCLLAGHVGHEIGHKAVLEHMGLKPVLDLDLRLGEGTGGVLASMILKSSIALYHEMATFEEASVSGKT